MGEVQTDFSKEKEPYFRITTSPGFATGLVMHPPGSVIAWVIPDDWDAKKNGKHWAEFAPSITFEALNEPAEKLLAKQKAVVQGKVAQVSVLDTESAKRFAAMEQMQIKMMEENLKLQAAIRFLTENAAEKAESKKK